MIFAGQLKISEVYSMNVFVYGTLMQGFPNHQIIAEYIDEIHEAGVEGKLYAVGGFPGLIEGDGEVKGELLVIDEDFKKEVLNKLDRLEGCPDLFKREKKQVLMPENGAKKEA